MEKFSVSETWLNDRKCPICGSVSYIETYREVPDGSDDHPDVESYHCKGCSVVFTDPFAFGSAAREKSGG